MTKEMKLKFSHGPSVAPENINLTPVTVFVGPNNSGKSKILSEIHQLCMTGTQPTTNAILDLITFDEFTPDSAKQHIAELKLTPRKNEALPADHIVVGKWNERIITPYITLTSSLQKPNINQNNFCRLYLRSKTLILDGKNRIDLVKEKPATDLQSPPNTSLQTLFTDDKKREEVRRIVHEAFGSYLVVDPTNLGKLRLRLSPRAPISAGEERGIETPAIEFHSQAQSIEEASDGVKAFTGMLMEIIAGDPSVILIDEPEAFLHPSLSNKLGLEISRVSRDSNKRLFVSTHSSNFVMGCIQSGAPVNIIRLTYRDKVATARVLPKSDILRLMRNPLLRSTGVISGLFYEYVIVTEADSDRAFYQEINERLRMSNPGRGIPNCLFINAQNKQTVQTIIRPLRALGIPTAGIVDIDVLKDGGKLWSSFLESGNVPEIDRETMALTRKKIKESLEATEKNMKRDGGISLLKGDELETGNNLMDKLAEYGLFVVRRGELESWLPDLNASGHGPAWLISVFEEMGEDPNTSSYLHPSDGDVWDFLKDISVWLRNSSRKGIPR